MSTIAATKMKKARKRSKTPRVAGFQVLENECIWMKAGVVNFHLCDHAYDCSHCAFDKGMRKAMKIKDHADSRDVAPRWAEHLQKTYRGASRPCRHYLTGRIEAPKICSLNYECYHCAFDQMLDEADVVQSPRAPSCQLASGYRVADGYYYHVGHNWVRFEHGGRVRVGFDDFAAKLFGAPETLNLPPLGEGLKQNQAGWTFARAGRQAAVLAPISGTVLAVNHKAVEHPQILAADPYAQGWLMIIEPKMPHRDLKGLFFGRQSLQWMEQEVSTLMGMLGEQYERLAATGGGPISDIYGHFSELDWDGLVQRFLGTARK